MAVTVKEDVERRGKLAARAAARVVERRREQLAARVVARVPEARREPQAVLVAEGADRDGADVVSGSGAATLFLLTKFDRR